MLEIVYLETAFLDTAFLESALGAAFLEVTFQETAFLDTQFHISVHVRMREFFENSHVSVGAAAVDRRPRCLLFPLWVQLQLVQFACSAGGMRPSHRQWAGLRDSLCQAKVLAMPALHFVLLLCG